MNRLHLMTTHISNLMLLPDEILLEIYKYLLNSHVLYSFYGLNQRLNTSIAGYYRHRLLSDVSYGQYDYLCRHILPDIGSQIESLAINNCRSVLQGKAFSQYYSNQMSRLFPNLRQISLVCFTGDELIQFLNTLTHFEHLDQIEIRDVLTDQSNLFQHVVETNNHRFTTVKFKTSYLELPSDPCVNILNLTISIQALDKLSDLLSILPNIRQLDVTIDEISMMEASFDHLSPLLHLNHFSLRCFNHFWLLEEIYSLLSKIPTIEYLSFQLSSHDSSFVDTKQPLFDILPKSLREFHISLRYYYDSIEEIDRHALLTSRFPIICLIDEDSEQALLHTIPYRMGLLNISTPMVKQMASWENYTHLDKFYDYLGMTLAETLPIIARCHRIKEIDIQYDKNDQLSTVQQQPPVLPRLAHLKRVWLMHPSREYQSLKSILEVAPNLSELFIAFDNLLPILDDKDTCQLLGKRIIHLLILRTAPSAPTTITEEYIPTLATIFTRLRHLQIDVTNGPLIESIVQSIIHVFKEQAQLISLVVEGQSSCDQLKSNARQWLIDNTYLTSEEKFDAEFKEQTNRFLLWM